jgi:DNA-binding LacI/PurR family transcriptional regulator
VEAATQVLDTGATAVLAYNDLVAVGILSRLSELGIAVPEQLSVVGFDDIPLAAMVIPPLTTVSLPTTQAGEVAVEVLLERLQSRGSGEPAARNLTAGNPAARKAFARKLPATLVLRSSSAPPPRRGRRPAWPGRARRRSGS